MPSVAIKTLLSGSVLEWKNEDYHRSLLFQSKEQATWPTTAPATLGAAGAVAEVAVGWMEWYRKKGIPCESISLLSGRILLLEPPVEEGRFTLLHILIDGKVGWIAVNKWDMKRLEVLG